MNKKLSINKKGDLPSLLIVGVVLFFAFSVISIFFSHTLVETIEELKDSDQFSENTEDIMTDVQDKTIPLMDFTMMFFFFSAVIGMIVSAVYVRTSPVMVAVFILLLIITIIIAGQFVNLYDEIKQTPEISSTSSGFTKTNMILGKAFPALILIAGVLVLIVLYSKSRYAGEV
jgi:hypothetical protein